MSSTDEVTISQRIDGGWEVCRGGFPIGVVVGDPVGGKVFTGKLLHPGEDYLVINVDLDECGMMLADEHRQRGLPFWERGKENGRSQERAQKKRPRLRKGERVESLDELAELLRTDPSVFYKNKATASGFVISMQFRTVYGALVGGQFHKVIRLSKKGPLE